MRTVVINTEDANSYASGLREAAGAIRDGVLVVFPTETVYGIAANATDPDALARLRAAKGRPDTRPFTVHLGQRGHARRYLTSASPLLRRLIRKGWPGPLTLLCEEPSPEKTQVAGESPPARLDQIYRDGLVGLRCPDHPEAARLLTEAGVPVVASSANRRGHRPTLDAHEALRELEGLVGYVVDAGRTRYKTASTIVEVRANEWKVVRPGATDQRHLEHLARSEVLLVCTGNSCRSPMAEYLFRHELARRLECPVEQLAPAGYHVSSAGTMAPSGGPASSGAREEMARRAIDIAGHRSQPLTPELIRRAERIYVMSSEHRRAVVDMAPGAAGRVELFDARGPVADPIGGSADEYRVCADQLLRAVTARVEEFLHEDSNW